MPRTSIPVPLPRIARFERLAYGLFLHWGLYSQLGAGEWVMLNRKIGRREYNKLRDTFTAEEFDAGAWARLARAAGMKYITLTTRHHEGFSLYDTRGLTRFDAPHAPAGRDLVAEFVRACRAEDLVPFLYHTTIDWQWLKPVRPFPADGGPRFNEYLDYLHASVEILCRNYGPIGGFWFDGNWAHPAADWKEDRLYALIRRHQPDALIINNTGLDKRGATGHPEIDCTTFEQGLPSRPDRRGLAQVPGRGDVPDPERALGHRVPRFPISLPSADHRKPVPQSQSGSELSAECRSHGTGGIPEYEAAALRRTGEWVALYAKILREGRPVDGVRCGGRDFVLKRGRRHFYFAFDLPIEGVEHVSIASGPTGVRSLSGLKETIRFARWLDNGEALTFAHDRSGLLALACTPYPYGTQLVVRVAELG